MDMDMLIAKLRAADDILRRGIEGIRFRGEEQSQFRFKYNLDSYCGTLGTEETPVSGNLSNGIWYAKVRSQGRQYDEVGGQPIPGRRYGFPLVMAINTTPYHKKPGLESDEEVLLGIIKQEDIFVLFDDKTDHLKELIGHSPWYTSLKRVQQQALDELSM